MAKPVTKTPRGREQRHVNGYMYAQVPVTASKMANVCGNTAATRILYLREQWDYSTILYLFLDFCTTGQGRSTQEFLINLPKMVN